MHRPLGRRRLTVQAAATLLLLASPSAALDPGRSVSQYRRQAWTTRSGLPQSSPEALLQTREGWLWIGTQEGLARFDGVAFALFDRRTVPALRHNRVVALHEDAGGSLWIGTEGGGATSYLSLIHI